MELVSLCLRIWLYRRARLENSLTNFAKEGFPRVEVNGRFQAIEDLLTDGELPEPNTVRLVIDRMSVSHETDTISRLSDSVETAFLKVGESVSFWFMTAKKYGSLVFRKGSRQTVSHSTSRAS